MAVKDKVTLKADTDSKVKNNGGADPLKTKGLELRNLLKDYVDSLVQIDEFNLLFSGESGGKKEVALENVIGLIAALTGKADLISGKLDPNQLPFVAIIKTVVSAQTTLAGFIANELNTNAYFTIEKGDAVKITNGSEIHVHQLQADDATIEANYLEIANVTPIDWSNVLNKADATETVKGILELADQSESETAADVILGNRDHTRALTARGFRWALNKVLLDVALTFYQITTFVQTPVFHRNFRHIPTSIPTFSANQNNLDLSTSGGIVFIAASTPINITGIAAEGYTGIRKEIINVDNGTGNNPITFVHESTSSTSTNRFITPTGQNIVLKVKQRAFLTYVTHGGVSRWLVEVVDYDTLTGYSVGADTALAATDTRIAAFGKIQGQLNARLPLSGGNLTGPLNQAKGANKASAATVDLATVTGDTVHITGTNAITSLGTLQAGAKKTLIFDGILTLTHNATSLILPSEANIITAVGDVAQMVSEGSGNWKCEAYTRANGKALIGSGGLNLGDVSSTKTPAELDSLFGAANFDDKAALIISTVNYGHYRKTATSWEFIQTKDITVTSIGAWGQSFEANYIVGSESSPVSGNVVFDFSKAIRGKKVVIFHQAASITFTNSDDLLQSNDMSQGIYVPNAINKITLEYVDATNNKVTIKYEGVEDAVAITPIIGVKGHLLEDMLDTPKSTMTGNGGSVVRSSTRFDNYPGVHEFNTSTATNGRSGARMGNSVNGLFLNTGKIWKVGAVARLANLSDATDAYSTAWAYFTDADATIGSSYLGFRYTHSENSGKIQFISKSNTGGGSVVVDTGILFAVDTWYEVFTVLDVVNQVARGYINGVLVATVSTLNQLPINNADNVRAFYGRIIKSAGTNARILYLAKSGYYVG